MLTLSNQAMDAVAGQKQADRRRGLLGTLHLTANRVGAITLAWRTDTHLCEGVQTAVLDVRPLHQRQPCSPRRFGDQRCEVTGSSQQQDRGGPVPPTVPHSSLRRGPLPFVRGDPGLGSPVPAARAFQMTGPKSPHRGRTSAIVART